MGGGNGAKAAQKRERALKDAKGGANSQLKVNTAAMNKKCATCMQPFLQTANKKVRQVVLSRSLDEFRWEMRQCSVSVFSVPRRRERSERADRDCGACDC